MRKALARSGGELRPGSRVMSRRFVYNIGDPEVGERRSHPSFYNSWSGMGSKETL
jgi:hypothetical protein